MGKDRGSEHFVSKATVQAPRGFGGAIMAVCGVGMVLASGLVLFLFCRNLGAMRAGANLFSGIIFSTCIEFWNLVPYVVLLLMGFGIRRSRNLALVVLVGAVLITGLGETLRYSSLLVHPDAQSAIGLIFIPLYQMVGVAMVAGVVGLLHYFTKG